MPLTGLTVLNTREAEAGAALTTELTARGARVIACPTIGGRSGVRHPIVPSMA